MDDITSIDASIDEAGVVVIINMDHECIFSWERLADDFLFLVRASAHPDDIASSRRALKRLSEFASDLADKGEAACQEMERISKEAAE